MFKKIIAFLVSAVLVAGLAACGAAQEGTSPSQASTGTETSTSEGTPAPEGESKGTFKIGFLGALTGNAAALGTDARNALLLWSKLHNNQIGGYDIEMFIEDDEDNAQTSLTKGTKLIEMNDVDMIIGPQNSAAAAALQELVLEHEVPLFMYSSSLDTLTKWDANDMCVRFSLSTSQGTQLLGAWMAEQGYKRAAMVAFDFQFGYESCSGFQKTFEEGGGVVVSKQFAPANTMDYAPLLTNINFDDIDVFFYNYNGGDGLRITQQLIDMGAHEKVAIVNAYNGTDEVSLKDLSPQLAETDFYSAMPYTPSLQNPENEAFLASYLAEYGTVPSNHAECVFTILDVCEQMLASGIVTDPADGLALAQAVRAQTDIHSPRGTIKGFDEYGGIITPVCIRKLELVDGKLQNVIVEEIEEVSQFWTWSPEEYLAMPAYSMDYPPITA